MKSRTYRDAAAEGANRDDSRRGFRKSRVLCRLLDDKTRNQFFLLKFPVLTTLPIEVLKSWLHRVGVKGAQAIARHRELYRYVAGSTPTEAEIKTFMDVCPPFRGACYSLVMAWYDGALRLQNGKPSAGRNDLMMATYLPYCGRFVTDDWPQEMRLREIATEAGIDCEVLSYEKFNSSLTVTVSNDSSYPD